MKKLNLGSGGHLLEGWDNLDLQAPAIICDLRQPLSYPDASVSHIFSEHFIEHLDEGDGFRLMQECYRVLIPGGRLRYSCPDLRQYVESYLRWDQDKFSDKSQFSSGTHFLNYAMVGEAFREGHRYYYDEAEMRKKLTAAKFKGILRCRWRESQIIEFQGLEWRRPMRDLIVEATK